MSIENGISFVRFVTLNRQQSAKMVNPAQNWEPVYPLCFQKAAMTLLMCSNAQTIQPFLHCERHGINVFNKLPREVCAYIASFMARRCNVKAKVHC